MPQRDELGRLVRVRRPIRGDVREARTDQGHEKKQRDIARKMRCRNAVTRQSSVRPPQGQESRQGEADTIGMESQRTEMKNDGDGAHD